MPRSDKKPVVVVGASLAEAYAQVRKQFGEDAAILGSRNASRQQKSGLGREDFVEVLVQQGGLAAGHTPRRKPSRENHSGGQGLLASLARDVAILEQAVAGLVSAEPESPRERPSTFDPLGEALSAAGASPEAADRLMTRFTSATGLSRSDRPAALAWLEQEIPTGNGNWQDLPGWHAFIGASGSGRTELALRAAGRLRREGQKTILLQVLAGKPGEVRRLQTSAAEHGFDAAVIRSTEQLAKLEDSLRAYDAVLLDLPPFDTQVMEPGGRIHQRLADDENIHHHLVLPLDGDFADLSTHLEAARSWNCDWIAITRLDRSGRPAKILDLLERFPLPVGLLNRHADDNAGLELATAGKLLDLMLADTGVTPESSQTAVAVS